MQLLLASITILLVLFSQITKADESLEFHLGTSGLGYGSGSGFIYNANLGIAKGINDRWQLAIEGFTPGSSRDRTGTMGLANHDRIQLGMHYNFQDDFSTGSYVGGGFGYVNKAGAVYGKAGYRFRISESYRMTYAPSLTLVKSQENGLLTVEFLNFSILF